MIGLLLSIIIMKERERERNEERKQRGWEETLGGDGCVYGIGCADSSMGKFLSPNLLCEAL